MIYRVEFPSQDAKYIGGTIKSWLKGAGDPIGFGDDLYEVEIDRVVRLGKTKRASMLSRSGRSLKRLRNESTEREPKGRVTLRATAAEPEAHLREILVDSDVSVPVGTVIGLATSTADEPCPRDVDVAELPSFRLVLNALNEAG